MKELKECLLCGKKCRTEEHQVIFGLGLHPKEEQFWVTVDLCPECHRTSPYSVHNYKNTSDKVRAYAERVWLQQKGATVENFIRIYGEDYIQTQDDERDPSSVTANEK